MIVIHIYLKPGTIRMTDIWIYTVHREHLPGNKVITEESKIEQYGDEALVISLEPLHSAMIEVRDSPLISW